MRPLDGDLPPAMSEDQPVQRYGVPAAALWGDYLRAGIGIALTGAPLILIEPLPIFTAILAGLCALFAWFFWRTARLQRTVVALRPASITREVPGHAAIGLDALQRFELRFYGPRKRPEAGWMQLLIADGATTLRLDSQLDGFADIAAHAYEAARARGLTLDPTTEDNLTVLGLA